MKIKHPTIGVCGLSCRLCPRHHTEGKSVCNGCKTGSRMAAGCPFITCAVKKKGIEFCWDCEENETCEKWRKHREAGKKRDSFKCYQSLEDDIAFVQKNGVAEFEKAQKSRERLLKTMLTGFDEGRSKSYYCIAATVLTIDELKDVLEKAIKRSRGLDIKSKSIIIHSELGELAKENDYCLKLRH